MSAVIRNFPGSAYSARRASVTEKRCTRCQLTMPLDYFSPRGDSKGGHASQCRGCRNLIRREANKADREAIRPTPEPFLWWPAEPRAVL